MPEPTNAPRTKKKTTLPMLFKKVSEGKPITWLTCYDYPTAYLQEQAGIDMILVGDSLGMTMLGLRQHLAGHHGRHDPACLCRAAWGAEHIHRWRYALHELPALGRDCYPQCWAVHAEAGCDAIKLEGGVEMADRISGIVAAGIPAHRHLD